MMKALRLQAILTIAIVLLLVFSENVLAATPNDTHFSRQWGMIKIQAPQAWDITHSSPSVRIAILDTGIDQDHPDLQGKIVASRNFSSSGTMDDVYNQGTHVAGIAAADTNNATGVAGLGYDSSLMIAKVSTDSGVAWASWVAQAITWAVDGPDGDPATDDGAKVINISLLFTSPSPAIENAVNYAWDHGVVLVASAGNTGGDESSSPMYPAAYDNVIAVAATQADDTLAGFSTYGDWVDVAAPGLGILSTVPVPPNEYRCLSGTSMAAPHVSGLAALVFNTVSDINGNGRLNDEVRYAIESTCDDIGVSGIGHGRINAYRAVTASLPAEPEQPPDTPSNISPSNGATNVSVTPTLQSSAFSDPNSGDTHAASQWQVTSTSGDYSSPVFDSGANTSNKTQITPSGNLSENTTYYWHVRHQDNHGAWSSWSAETSFNTDPLPTVPSITVWGGLTTVALLGLLMAYMLSKEIRVLKS